MIQFEFSPDCGSDCDASRMASGKVNHTGGLITRICTASPA